MDPTLPNQRRRKCGWCGDGSGGDMAGGLVEAR